MKTIGAVLVGIMLVGLAGCSDSIVGTDGELSNPSFKKGGGKGRPAAETPVNGR